jgi:hypothetical protein
MWTAPEQTRSAVTTGCWRWRTACRCQAPGLLITGDPRLFKEPGLSTPALRRLSSARLTLTEHNRLAAVLSNLGIYALRNRTRPRRHLALDQNHGGNNPNSLGDKGATWRLHSSKDNLHHATILSRIKRRRAEPNLKSEAPGPEGLLLPDPPAGLATRPFPRICL